MSPAFGTVLFRAENPVHGTELWRPALPTEAPVAGDDAYATDEDTALVVAAPVVLGNDSDPDGGTLIPGGYRCCFAFSR